MKNLPKILVLLGFFLFFFFPTSAYAASNFITDYHVTYTVHDDETTQATIQVTLTNQTTQYYASSYRMQLGFSDISNLTAADPGGPLQPQMIKTNDGYLLDITFNQKAVGQGDKLTFMVTFDTNQVAKKHGNVWEINVPGIANPDEFQSFVVDVKVPDSFGIPTYIKPQQTNNSLTFTKDQLGKSGISIAFGEKQNYQFDLAYHLANKNLYPTTETIALPSNTNYQDIAIDAIEPAPNNVHIDPDGNWIAEYSLYPTQKIDVVVSGTATIHLTPKEQILSKDDYGLYTRPMKYWETTDPQIMALASQLQTPQAIYNYVIKKLKYDFTRISDKSDRLGAVEAEKNPTEATCREFTDLFIAIARAAGIPAREVNGFAYTENPRQRPISIAQDILHAWPEYYDENKKTWVMVDPTWGSTTGGIDYFNVLDNDHIAFVVKGIDSQLPLPAGAYKQDSSSGLKDINIDFAKDTSNETPDLTLQTQFASPAIAGLPIKGSIIIKNNGSTLAPAQVFSISSNILTPSDQLYQYDAIPPFGSRTVPVTFYSKSFLTNADSLFTIRYSSQGQSTLGAQTTATVTVAPFYKTIPGVGGLIVLLTIIILIIAARSGRLSIPWKRR